MSVKRWTESLKKHGSRCSFFRENAVSYLILICLISILLSSCTKDSAVHPSEHGRTDTSVQEAIQDKLPDKFRKYRLDGTLIFSVPESWDLFMESESDVSFEFENGFFEAKIVRKKQKNTPEDALDSVLTVWSEKYDVLSKDTITVDGHDAVYEQVEQPFSENLVFKYDAVVIDAADRYYVMYLQTSNKEEVGNSGIFDAVLESVGFENSDSENVEESIGGEESKPSDLADDAQPKIENEIVPESDIIKAVGFSLDSVPAYDGEPFTEVNGNIPYFQEKELTSAAFKRFTVLDKSGRCSTATACLGPETIPSEPRESIGMIKPSGWHTVKYDGIDGNYLYNRCHLIGFQLCGENANELNLITGTRYMNTQGMEPLETNTAYYIQRTGNHVLYRVTPVFDGKDLVAKGVLMEARSVEEDDYSFCIFCYNVQPGIVIDYSTGDSRPE